MALLLVTAEPQGACSRLTPCECPYPPSFHWALVGEPENHRLFQLESIVAGAPRLTINAPPPAVLSGAKEQLSAWRFPQSALAVGQPRWTGALWDSDS